MEIFPVLQTSPIYRQHRDISRCQLTGNISAIYRPDIFPDFFGEFSRFFHDIWWFLAIFADFSRYLPIFSNVLWFFVFFVFLNIFVFFILPIYCRCLPTFSPINPIISFWTLSDIFANTIFVTLISISRNKGLSPVCQCHRFLRMLTWFSSTILVL